MIRSLAEGDPPAQPTKQQGLHEPRELTGWLAFARAVDEGLSPADEYNR